MHRLRIPGFTEKLTASFEGWSGMSKRFAATCAIASLYVANKMGYYKRGFLSRLLNEWILDRENHSITSYIYDDGNKGM